MNKQITLPKLPMLIERIKPYVSITRPDHWFKNVFMLPGFIFGILLTEKIPSNCIAFLCLGILSTCLSASANYVLNEWLDRKFDLHHPTKKYRSSVNGNLKPNIVYLEYSICAFAGLSLACLISIPFLVFTALLLIMGIVYNVPPMRTKDLIYLDVLSESLNNPIRFLLGWSLIDFNYLPPSSILLAYWMGGAFLMGIKRFAEYRFIGNPQQAASYRQSFKLYNENSLLISSFFYALCSAFFLGVFLIKYRIEYLLILPFLALLFAWYLRIGLSKDSTAQHPEKLYREKSFLGYLVFLCGGFLLLSFVDHPWLQFLLQKSLTTWK